MGNTPWHGDACSLVDEFRAGRRTPAEELQATYEAIDASTLNAFCYLPREQAEAAARVADVNKPFGGVPIGVKELDQVEGWPDTHASVPLKDQVAGYTSTMVQRVRDDGGAVLVGLTNASEFGGVNVTRTTLHGTTHSPWQHGRTPGGSSGGTAAAVSGGLVTLGTAGDGGGSIRIPAGFTGMVGLKATIGRIPRGPRAAYGNLTVTIGCISRSVRDTARWSSNVAAMKASGEPWQLITTFNEWGEGTGVENTTQYGSTYLSMLAGSSTSAPPPSPSPTAAPTAAPTTVPPTTGPTPAPTATPPPATPPPATQPPPTATPPPATQPPPTAPPTAPPSGTAVLVGAGDIASCASSGDVSRRRQSSPSARR